MNLALYLARVRSSEVLGGEELDRLALGVTVPRKEQSVFERAIYFRSLSSVIIRWTGLVPMFSVQWVMGSR
jgi:hypothetical protein